MEPKNPSEWTDEALLKEAKKIRNHTLFMAGFIGFNIGIVLFSVVVNSWGFFTLIPLYIVYSLMKTPKSPHAEEVEKLLRERKLK